MAWDVSFGTGTDRLLFILRIIIIKMESMFKIKKASDNLHDVITQVIGKTEAEA